MVTEKKIFHVFSIVSLWQIMMPPRVGHVWTPGPRLAGFIKRTTIHCYTMSGPCGFGKKSFLCFSHDYPGAGAVWTPGARLAGFIKRTTIHCYTQNMKALGLVASEKKIFLCFSHCKSMGANDPRGGATFDSRGMVGRSYEEDHYTLLHTKYKSSWPCGFEEDFFMFFPMMPLGRGPYGPQGHG